MRENTNKSLAVNSVILYIRLLVTSVCALFTAKFALKALGITDYGLFSVLGGIISFIAIFNTIMLSTSNRFIAVAVGRNDVREANEQFNINLVIHIGIAIVTLLIAIPLGDWYIYNYLNYSGDIDDVVNVFHVSVIGSIISFVGVPFNGLLMAKERFWVFSMTDILSCATKTLIAYILIDHFQNKLIIYAIAIAVFTAYPTIVFAVYCRRKFPELVYLKLSKNKEKYKKVFSFAGWISYGAVATVGKNQGAAILVNLFFNTIMNTALGIANSINSIIITFAQNITKPIAPQITKNYAAGNTERCIQLMVLASKGTFMMMLFISCSFFISPEWLIQLWLGEVPPFVVSFITLLIIDALIDSLNSGISEIIFASGKIKMFQLTINTIRLLAIALAYLLLRSGLEAWSLFYAYIICTSIAFVVRQIVLKRTINIDNSVLFKKAYFPCLAIVLLFLPILYLSDSIHPLLKIIIGLSYLSLLIILVGLTKNERGMIINILKKHK